MAKRPIKYGTVEVPAEAFLDENITAHISIRLPLVLLKELKRLSLTEKYEGRYQILIRDVLEGYVNSASKAKRHA